MPEHFVQFYESDAFLLDAVGSFSADALRAGDASVVIATPGHRDGIEERLRATGLDVSGAIARGQYVPLDAAATLDRILVHGEPHPGRFASMMGDVLTAAAGSHRRVSVFGEMVALLTREGNHNAAVGLEALWNDAQRKQPFTLFCAYPMDGLRGATDADLVDAVCAAHSRVIPAESFTTLPVGGGRDRAIALLQQKAIQLEAEIAERSRVEEHLRVALAAERVARSEAEMALRLRDEFLSIAAHELRNPLTALTCGAQLLLRRLRRTGEKAADPAVPALEAITAQADRLSRLIDRLLDVSRLEAGKPILRRQATDVALLVERAVAAARVTSARQTITVHGDAPPLEAVVDPLRLEQVLVNVLDNAMRHNPVGSPIEVRLSQPKRGAFELSVRDHGPGIPPERRGRIFERFFQGDNEYQSGLGLGLYVSQQIVAQHGGELYAEFPAEGGARFVISLPVAAADPPIELAAD